MSQAQTDISLHEVAHKTLQQAIDLIDHLPTDTYTRFSTVMPGSTVGKHIRHLYDHFVLLFNTAISDQPRPCPWQVDFDERARNPTMESDRGNAIAQLRHMQSLVEESSAVDLATPVTLAASIDAAVNTKHHYASSFGRELWYCCIHAVHHFASIKAICIEFGETLPETFGMAPSTIQHHQK
ncbi:uncharacterized protein BYT42DRAFT_307183 [Radiomyces spectabilis]|uniref:uncharacterized protein n=1 Tax=Radiomyces spectabilis TaxID=64574 RepID=UPI00221E6E92|nr:uncharacterized protein BYT42DRAFT_307183 [Radiomyces spectabilis]KAI8381485.1 hypothetical protein BYT42DRAFT_307183 [Radiomyces spectabilis]